MPLPKPGSFLEWTDGDAAKVDEPVAAKKLLGFVPTEKPSPFHHNWLWFQTDQWLKRLDSVQDEQLTAGYAAVVNSDPAKGSHETLQAALADAVVVPGSRILVTSDLEIDTTIQVSKQQIEIEFVPGATIIKGVGAAASNFRGMEFTSTANSSRLKHARFSGFSGTGDVALWLDVGSAYNLFFNNIFASGNTQNFEANSNPTYQETLTVEEA